MQVWREFPLLLRDLVIINLHLGQLLILED